MLKNSIFSAFNGKTSKNGEKRKKMITFVPVNNNTNVR